MNRKAQFEPARKTVFWMLSGAVICLVILAFAMVLVSYVNDLTSVPSRLKAELTTLRFTNSPECLAYRDQETGAVFPGVIDFEKYSSLRLDQSCYSTPDEKGYFLFNFGMDLENTPNSLIHTNNYYNHDAFTLFREVLIREKGRLRKDVLRIYVQEKIP